MRREFSRQGVQQFGVRRRIVRPHVVRRVRESVAKQPTPNSVDHGLAEILRSHHQLGQLPSPIDLADQSTVRDRLTVQLRIGHPQTAVRQPIEQLCVLDRPAFAGIVRVRQGDDLRLAAAFDPQLTKECVQLPEVSPLPTIGRMSVAAGAHQLLAQEDAGRTICCLRGVLLRSRQKKIDGSVEILRARLIRTTGGQQLEYDLLLRLVCPDHLRQVGGQSPATELAIGGLLLGGTDQRGGPPSGPVPGKFVACQQTVDQLPAMRLVLLLGPHELLEFVAGGVPAGQSQVRPIAPILV